MAVKLKAMPAEEAVKFFRQKGYLVGFSWQDIEPQAHKTAFTVAKIMQLDLLEKVRGEVDKALNEGNPFDQFMMGLKPALLASGWWGETDVTDPVTGEVKTINVTPSRLRRIYNTNLRTAHSEGQWARIQDTKDVLPYLIYDANNSENPRHEHSAWDQLVFHVDDPWVPRHFPVKDFGCKCRMRPATKRQVERRGLKIVEGGSGSFIRKNGKVVRIKEPVREFVNRRTGEVSKVPVGVHPAFNSPPGGWYENLRKHAQSKLDELPPSLRRAIGDIIK